MYMRTGNQELGHCVVFVSWGLILQFLYLHDSFDIFDNVDDAPAPSSCQSAFTANLNGVIADANFVSQLLTTAHCCFGNLRKQHASDQLAFGDGTQTNACL